MPTVGMVGGLGPERTIDYYPRIVQTWRHGHTASYPPIVTDSPDVVPGLRLVAKDLPR